MARSPVSVIDSTVMLSCFVMGAELLLLFAYIRTQILVGIKRRILSLVENELLRADRYRGNDAPIKRPSFEDFYSTFCANSHNSSSLLAILGYVLATVSLLSMLSKTRDSKNNISNGPTLIVSAAAGLVVFLGSQWAFLKVAVLPFYADLYNKVTRHVTAKYESDSPAVTLALLAPTIVCLCVFFIAGALWFLKVDWGAVVFTAMISVLSLGTEVISWFLMKGFAVPVTEIVSAITDAVVAVQWVNVQNSPEHAVRRLRETLFPDESAKLTASNILKHVYRDHFDRRRLEVTDHGALVVRKTESEKIRALLMIGCSLCLLLAPFVVVALRAPAVDAAVIVFQLVLIAATYGIYMVTTGQTTTMRRITAAVTT